MEHMLRTGVPPKAIRFVIGSFAMYSLMGRGLSIGGWLGSQTLSALNGSRLLSSQVSQSFEMNSLNG
jgi:hypothetical protein